MTTVTVVLFVYSRNTRIVLKKSTGSFRGLEMETQEAVVYVERRTPHPHISTLNFLFFSLQNLDSRIYLSNLVTLED